LDSALGISIHTFYALQPLEIHNGSQGFDYLGGLMKLIKVKWIDAIGADGWTDIKEIRKEVPVVHYSVGYIAKETKEFITITMSYDKKKEQYGAWLCIPKQFILETEPLN